MDTSTEWKYHRLVIVEEDKTVEVMEEVADKVDHSEYGELIKLATTVGSAFAKGFLNNFVWEHTAELINNLGKAKERGADIKTVSQSKAVELTFPPGHPRQGVVYAQHPADDRVFYTAATFHRLAFEHKFAEVITLLSFLGAQEIVVQHVRGRNDVLSASAGISMPGQPANVSGSLDKTGSEKSSTLFTASLVGSTEPCSPPDMVWYPHEPLWQMIAKARMEKGLKDFNLSLDYEDDYGINAGLKVAVNSAGLDLGGRFEDHESTKWQITGTFAPLVVSP